jgi:hypothetical protein
LAESRNHGPEQERLNALRGATLRITGLRAARGPGIELLEYLAPAGGRPYPDDVRANDLVYWQTELIARNGDALDHLGRPLALPDASLGFARVLTLRDPDGHALEVGTP